MAGFRIEGNTSGNVAEVNAGGHIKVVTEIDAYGAPQHVGATRIMGEVDAGYITSNIILRPQEIDNDYRTRVSQDVVLDEEVFNYTAQNTGKHSLSATTMAASFTAGQFTTNSTSITTITTGVQLASYAAFPTVGTTTLSLDSEIAFSAQPKTNTFVEWGLGIPGTQLIAPTDGVFFRLSASGLQGVSSYNGSETTTGVFPLADSAGTWVYADNKRYQFIIYQSVTEAVFWVNDGTGAVMLGRIPLPIAQPRMSMAAASQAFFKHRIIGGAASGSLQAYVGAYTVRQGGTSNTSTPSEALGRVLGTYQGLSGGTMGSLANYANNTNPVAAVPTNTTAALGSGLGGQFWETATLAVNTDGVVMSYQVPAGTVNVQGRRLLLRGVGLTSYVQTAVVGGPYVAQYSLAFGHTTLSLATAEAATTKAARRIALAPLTQVVTAAQAASTMVAQPGGSYVDLSASPVYVNPGEFIQLVTKHVGTVATAGTVAHVVTLVYGWE